MYEILKKLREKKIPCRLLLDEHDADVVLSYEGRSLFCRVSAGAVLAGSDDSDGVEESEYDPGYQKGCFD